MAAYAAEQAKDITSQYTAVCWIGLLGEKAAINHKRLQYGGENNSLDGGRRDAISQM